MVKVQTMKGVANHIGPESCTVAGNSRGEALTGGCAGRAMEPRNLGSLGCRRALPQRKATSSPPKYPREAVMDPTRSERT